MTSNNFILIIVFSLWICSCKSTMNFSTLELGKYESKSFNKIELTIKRLVKNEIPSSGQKLFLNDDSTFVLYTCGNIISGYLKFKTDTLILLCLKNISISDTTNTTMYFPPSELRYHIVDNKTLFRYDIGKINNQNIILSDNLIKTSE